MSTFYLMTPNSHALVTSRMSATAAIDKQFDQVKTRYGLRESENKLKEFIFSHDLVDFLIWIHDRIADIYGNVEKTLHLNKRWDDEEYHLVLSIYSKLEDMDEVTVLENKLFQVMNENQRQDAIGDVVIAQR